MIPGLAFSQMTRAIDGSLLGAIACAFCVEILNGRNQIARQFVSSMVSAAAPYRVHPLRPLRPKAGAFQAPAGASPLHTRNAKRRQPLAQPSAPYVEAHSAYGGLLHRPRVSCYADCSAACSTGVSVPCGKPPVSDVPNHQTLLPVAIAFSAARVTMGVVSASGSAQAHC